MSGPSFTPEVVAAVCDHMNGDHPEDCRLIVVGLGGRGDAIAARMTGMDHLRATFEVELAGGGRVEVVVPFSAPVTERGQIRMEVVRMYHEACEALGVEPRAEGER